MIKRKPVYLLCSICGEPITENGIHHHGNNICPECVKKIVYWNEHQAELEATDNPPPGYMDWWRKYDNYRHNLKIRMRQDYLAQQIADYSQQLTELSGLLIQYLQHDDGYRVAMTRDRMEKTQAYITLCDSELYSLCNQLR